MASKVKYTSYRKEVMAALSHKVERNAHVVGLFLVAETKRKLNVQAPYRNQKMGTATIAQGSRVYKTREVARANYGTGAPPRKLTGTLKGSITYEVRKRFRSARIVGAYVVAVGSNIKYARRLELGWPKAPKNEHPYLRPTIAENRVQIIQKFTRGLF